MGWEAVLRALSGAHARTMWWFEEEEAPAPTKRSHLRS